MPSRAPPALGSPQRPPRSGGRHHRLERPSTSHGPSRRAPG